MAAPRTPPRNSSRAFVRGCATNTAPVLLKGFCSWLRHERRPGNPQGLLFVAAPRTPPRYSSRAFVRGCATNAAPVLPKGFCSWLRHERRPGTPQGLLFVAAPRTPPRNSSRAFVRGCATNTAPELIKGFCSWLRHEHRPGTHQGLLFVAAPRTPPRKSMRLLFVAQPQTKRATALAVAPRTSVSRQLCGNQVFGFSAWELWGLASPCFSPGQARTALDDANIASPSRIARRFITDHLLSWLGSLYDRRCH